MRPRLRPPTLAQSVLALAALAASARAVPAGVVHDESLHGDLSGNRLEPTQLTLSVGDNLLIATSVSGDREYVTLTVPAGGMLSQILLDDYVSFDRTAFIGMQAGSTFTEPTSGTNVANLLGWTHFGDAFFHVGTDILDDIAAGAGARGFTPPLPSGPYTFWIQQTGAAPTSYRLNVVVVDAPESSVLLLCSLAAAGAISAGSLRRRRARSAETSVTDS